MLILCSPHNPIGRVWKEDELKQVAALAEKYNVTVVADEIHADLVLTGKHIPFAKVAEKYDVTIASCLAPTKTFNLAALQLSYVIFNKKEAQDKFEQHLQSQFVSIDNPFATVATIAAYEKGEAWLEKLLDHIRSNVSDVKETINKEMPRIRVHEPEGTYLVWLDFRDLGMTAPELSRWLREEAELALSDGHIFGKEGEGFARMNVACPKDHLMEGLSRLKRAYQQLNG